MTSKNKNDRAGDGRFAKGHQKLGGRTRGTPNVFSAHLKELVIEAAGTVGGDGRGADGLAGFITRMAEEHPKVILKLLGKIL